MAMILIDSLYINNSGGLRLLIYLIDELQKANVSFYLLADTRCLGKFDRCKHVRYMNASLRERKKFYKIKRHSFSSVLCFGNIPAPIKLNVPVYTYFHNINLLTLSEANNIKEKMMMWLKRQVFRFYKKNTDYWLVQTSNTANELVKNLGESEDRVKLMPFYELPDDLSKLSKDSHGHDYVYISDHYKGAKGHEELLVAWAILHSRGVNVMLHLTVHERNTEFIEKIKKAQNEGVSVVNHGFVGFEKVIELYKKSKVLIYPSHNESLGLGIIEAITAGCDVIGADLPYLRAICKPSVVFTPYSADAIADAVLKYENSCCKKSELTINNQIDNLIALLISNTV